MTNSQWLRDSHEKVMQWWASLTPEEQDEELKRMGILDRHGKLAANYGGDGERTERPPLPFDWSQPSER